MSLGQAALVSGVLFVAAVVQGIAGFAFMVVSATTLVLAFPAQTVVPGLILAYLPLGAAQTLQARRDVDRVLLARLLASAVLGLPLGALVLLHADTSAMRRGIGLVMVVLAVLLQVRPGRPIVRENAARWLVGAVSGFLGSATSVSGPPLVLFGLKQRWPARSFRATLLAYFTGISLLALPLHWHTGLLGAPAAVLALSGAPGLVLGFLAGRLLSDRVDERHFRRLGFGLVMAAGSVALAG